MATSAPRHSAFPIEARLTVSVRLAIALAAPALALSGCYVMPIEQHGTPYYAVGVPAAPAPTYQTNVPAPATYAGPPVPAMLHVRLYPANDLANRTGMMTGTVTNMLSGKGRFQFEYQGELLSGEATRVSGDERQGIANAYGQRGTYVSCQYRMSTQVQGAGTCNFNNGALYQVHIGN